MRPTPLFAAVALAACSPERRSYDCQLPTFRSDHPRMAEFQSFLDDERIALDLPGMSMAVRDRDGLWVGSSGYVDLETLEPRTACVPQPVASFTKFLTAVSVHQQVEAGTFAYTTTAGDLLNADLVAPVPNAASATAHDLLNHTAGIADLLDVSTVTSPMTLEQYLRHVGAVRAPEPGSFAYSGAGYVFLGLMVGEATGGQHSDAVLDGLIEPLGLNDTWYGSAKPVPLDRLARGYVRQGQGETFISFDLGAQSYANPNFDQAAGGAASTVTDLLTLVDAVLRDRTVLADTTIDAMLSFSDVPSTFAGGLVDGYGLGVLRLDGDILGYGASGSLLSYGADAYYLPDQDLTYALAYNGQSTGVPEMNRRLVAMLSQR